MSEIGHEHECDLYEHLLDDGEGREAMSDPTKGERKMALWEAMEFFGFWIDFCKRCPEDRFNDPYTWDAKDDEALSILRDALAEKENK